MIVEITNHMVPYGLRQFYGRYGSQEQDSLTHRDSRDVTPKKNNHSIKLD